MMKFIGIAVCTLFCCVFLKKYNKTFSIVLSIAGVSIMLLYASNSIVNIVNELLAIGSEYKSSFQYVKIMLKILGITLISQFVSDLCKENGELALSSIVIFISKMTVITLILPIFEMVLKIVVGLLK